MRSVNSLIDKAETQHSLSREELTELLSSPDVGDDLFRAADRVRDRHVGNEVHLRGLIETSNFCKNNCFYCGIRRDNALLKRYRLTAEQIFELAETAAALNYKTIVMQSGEDPYYTPERMTYIVRGIKERTGAAITLSIGEKTFDDYKAYRDAGADRYLIRIETTDKDLYHALDPQMSWDNRRRCLQDLKTLGYEVGSGSLIGLPDQTLSSIADDILFLKEIDVDMAGIGPFIPHPHTPLKDAAGGTLDLALRTMALTRLLLPDINIPATTAMETLAPDGRVRALQSGANVVMPNVSFEENKKLYELYPNKAGINGTAAAAREKVEQMLTSINRPIGTTAGFHIKATN